MKSVAKINRFPQVYGRKSYQLTIFPLPNQPCHGRRAGNWSNWRDRIGNAQQGFNPPYLIIPGVHKVICCFSIFKINIT